MASTFTNLLYHAVFSTKDRVPAIHEGYGSDSTNTWAASSAGNGASSWRSADFPIMSTF